jgi:hypothetical protein
VWHHRARENVFSMRCIATVRARTTENTAPVLLSACLQLRCLAVGRYVTESPWNISCRLVKEVPAVMKPEGTCAAFRTLSQASLTWSRTVCSVRPATSVGWRIWFPMHLQNRICYLSNGDVNIYVFTWWWRKLGDVSDTLYPSPPRLCLVLSNRSVAILRLFTSASTSAVGPIQCILRFCPRGWNSQLTSNQCWV